MNPRQIEFLIDSCIQGRAFNLIEINSVLLPLGSHISRMLSDTYCLSGMPDRHKAVAVMNDTGGACGMQKAAAVRHHYAFIHGFQNFLASGA